MKTLTKKIISIIIVACLIIFGVLLIKHKKHKLASADKYGLKPVPVWITKAKLGNIASKIDYLAIVEPIRIADISARVTATVEKVLYDEGDSVKAMSF